MDEPIIFNLPTTILREIYSGFGADVLGMRDVVLDIVDNKVKVKQRHESGAFMSVFESTCLNLEGIQTSVPMEISDLKSVIGLIKDGEIVFEVSPGITVCRVGKTKKTFPQPGNVEVPERIPDFALSNVFEISAGQLKEVSKAFKGAKDGIDVGLYSQGHMITFSILDKSEHRGTDVEFLFDELKNLKSEENALSGYDQSVIRMLLDTVVDDDTATYRMEFGKNMPIRFVKTSPIGTLTMLIAPKIYDIEE